MEINKKPNNRWGIFYFNKEDKRIFPPKSSGLGWTLNFANPYSYSIIIIIVIILVIIGYYTK